MSPSHEGVDRNMEEETKMEKAIVALSRGRGSKQQSQHQQGVGVRRPLTRAWIETIVSLPAGRMFMSRPLTRAWIETNKVASDPNRIEESPSHEGVDRNIFSGSMKG